MFSAAICYWTYLTKKRREERVKNSSAVLFPQEINTTVGQDKQWTFLKKHFLLLLFGVVPLHITYIFWNISSKWGALESEFFKFHFSKTLNCPLAVISKVIFELDFFIVVHLKKKSQTPHDVTTFLQFFVSLYDAWWNLPDYWW